jgi:hypothetical protein
MTTVAVILYLTGVLAGTTLFLFLVVLGNGCRPKEALFWLFSIAIWPVSLLVISGRILWTIFGPIHNH